MKNYLIIDGDVVQERIKELKRLLQNEHNPFINTSYNAELSSLERILSKSTPLIPEIEKAFDDGKGVGIISYQPRWHTLDKELYNERKQDYISNLKLDI